MREKETSWVFFPLSLQTGFSSGTQTGSRDEMEGGGGKRWEETQEREDGEKQKEVLWVLVGLSLTKGQETHSDPVIDLTTRVDIKTLSLTHLY